MSDAAFRSVNIANFEQKWQEIGASEVIKSWVKDGVRLPLRCKPEPFHCKSRVFSESETAWIDQEIPNLVRSGAIERCAEQPKYISAINVVPKKTKTEFRLIVDLRQLNSVCEPPSFRHEDIRTVLEQVKPGDHLVTIDIKKCFYHVLIHPDFREFVCIEWRNQFYRWRVLPFGLNCSPYFVYKVLRPVVVYLRSRGVRIVIYVDDILLMGRPVEIFQQRRYTLELLRELGWFVNFPKSSLEPDTRKDYIGFILDTAKSENNEPCVWIEIPKQRVSSLRRDIRRGLGKGQLSARALARIAGQCISMSRAVIPAKLLLRNIYRLLATRVSWQDYLVLDDGVRQDLEWWETALRYWNGRAVFNRTIDVQITTDASSAGWGAKLPSVDGDQLAQGVWNQRIAYKHSNYRELLAILMALHSFLRYLVNKCVQVLTDNVTAAAYLNFQGGPSVEMTDVACAIWDLCVRNNITISAKHLAGTANAAADWLSRRESHYEWMLNPAVFRYLERLWGPHTVDRFGSMATTQLPKFNSLFWDPHTSGVDALAQTDWGSENNYVNAPFRMLGRVIEVVCAQRAWATVIAPIWPGQPWLQKLKRLTVCAPVRLPNNAKACLQVGRRRPEPLKNRKWKLYAWRICGRIGLDS